VREPDAGVLGEVVMPLAAPQVACPRCGQRGRIVADHTLESILQADSTVGLLPVERRFCATPWCEVLYYGANGHWVGVSASRVRVGLKETVDPIPLCYCFGFSRADVRRQVAETGRSDIPERIEAEIRAKRCRCTTANPSGACCLAEVKAAVDEARSRRKDGDRGAAAPRQPTPSTSPLDPRSRPHVSGSKIVLVVVLAAAVAAFFAFDLGRFTSLAAIKEHQASLAALYAERPLAVLGVFFAVYVVITSLSLPGAVVMTLAAGAIFGLAAGTVLASFASSIGATFAFLSSRYLLRDGVQRRFGARLADVNAGMDRDGAFYLFSMRLVPVIPFFVVNLLMGLTGMRAVQFYLVSQVGMLAGTLVYVNAGTQLSKLDSLRDILSPGLVASFVLLGLFPLAARKVSAALQRRRARGAGDGSRVGREEDGTP
jgi:uncharacterized membrane protein YdjX (TVP38/TMEM64 family)